MSISYVVLFAKKAHILIFDNVVLFA